MKVEVGVLGSPSLISPIAFVDVKQHRTLSPEVRSQALRESRGGRLGRPVPNTPHCLCGRKATLNWNLPGPSDGVNPGIALGFGVAAQVVLALSLALVCDGEAILKHTDRNATIRPITTIIIMMHYSLRGCFCGWSALPIT